MAQQVKKHIKCNAEQIKAQQFYTEWKRKCSGSTDSNSEKMFLKKNLNLLYILQNNIWQETKEEQRMRADISLLWLKQVKRMHGSNPAVLCKQSALEIPYS